MKIRLSFFLIIFFCIVCGVGQTTITLKPVADAAIGFHDGANTGDNNYGTAIQNAAFCIPSAAAATGVNVNRALIKFDLSVVPTGATVQSAYLDLFAIGPTGDYAGHTGTANASYLERVTQNWQENTATWNNQPASTGVNQVLLPNSTSPGQDYLNINVLTLVKDMMSVPGNNFGFMLRMVSQQETNIMSFASRDHSNPSLHPRLRVTYKTSQTGDPPLGIGEKSEIDTVDAGFVQIIDLQGNLLKALQVETSADWRKMILPELQNGFYLCRYIVKGEQRRIRKILVNN